MINYNLLKTEIETDPQNLGFEEFISAGNDQAICDLLNNKNISANLSRTVTARTFFAELGLVQGATILEKLEAGAANSVALKWTMRWLQSPDGFDIGHVNSLSALESMRGTLLTNAETDAVKSLSATQISRAEELFGKGVVITNDIVAKALRG